MSIKIKIIIQILFIQIQTIIMNKVVIKAAEKDRKVIYIGKKA